MAAIVARHVRQDQISSAWEAFETKEDKGIEPSWKSYSISIKELCKVFRTDEAVKVLEKMHRIIHDDIFERVISLWRERERDRKGKHVHRICR